MGEPQVRLFEVTYRGQVRWTVEITTEHRQMQVGVSPTGRQITAYDPWPTPPGHYKKGE